MFGNTIQRREFRRVGRKLWNAVVLGVIFLLLIGIFGIFTILHAVGGHFSWREWVVLAIALPAMTVHFFGKADTYIIDEIGLTWRLGWFEKHVRWQEVKSLQKHDHWDRPQWRRWKIVVREHRWWPWPMVWLYNDMEDITSLINTIMSKAELSVMSKTWYGCTYERPVESVPGSAGTG